MKGCNTGSTVRVIVETNAALAENKPRTNREQTEKTTQQWQKDMPLITREAEDDDEQAKACNDDESMSSENERENENENGNENEKGGVRLQEH